MFCYFIIVCLFHTIIVYNLKTQQKSAVWCLMFLMLMLNEVFYLFN